MYYQLNEFDRVLTFWLESKGKHSIRFILLFIIVISELSTVSQQSLNV